MHKIDGVHGRFEDWIRDKCKGLFSNFFMKIGAWIGGLDTQILANNSSKILPPPWSVLKKWEMSNICERRHWCVGWVLAKIKATIAVSSHFGGLTTMVSW